MAHIALITSGIASIANANLELARRLARAGHRVTYASPDDIRALVEAQGLTFAALPTPGPAGAQQVARRRLGRGLRWLARFLTIQQRRRQAVDALGVRGFTQAIRELAPDLLLIDVELHQYTIAARAAGLPVALLSTWIALQKRPGLPPLHRAIVPGKGWAGSPLGIEWAWLRFRAWKRWHRLLQQVRSVGVSPLEVLERLAADVGFPFRDEVDLDQWLVPLSYRTLPVLCLNARELDLPHAPLPTYHYVGPMVNPLRVDPGGLRAPPDLEALLAQREGERRPLVYCAFGAFFKGDDTGFVQRVIRAVAERPEWDVVIGLGARLDPARLGPLPPHVHAYPWVPQLRVLERASCAIIHAGISTINECVSFGVPMLAYPFKQTTDQLGNAARISYHRLGIVADRDADTPDQIRGHVERILADGSFAEAVGQLRAAAQRYAHERRAEAVVERLLAAGGQPQERVPRG